VAIIFLVIMVSTGRYDSAVALLREVESYRPTVSWRGRVRREWSASDAGADNGSSELVRTEHLRRRRDW